METKENTQNDQKAKAHPWAFLWVVLWLTNLFFFFATITAIVFVIIYVVSTCSSESCKGLGSELLPGFISFSIIPISSLIFGSIFSLAIKEDLKAVFKEKKLLMTAIAITVPVFLIISFMFIQGLLFAIFFRD